MPNSAQNTIAATIAGAVSAAVARPDVSARSADAKPIADTVTAKVVPMILHETNNETWYQSRVTWGVLVAAVSTLLKPITGDFIDGAQAVEYADALTSGGQLFGFGLTIYGRWKARKPIGA